MHLHDGLPEYAVVLMDLVLLPELLHEVLGELLRAV